MHCGLKKGVGTAGITRYRWRNPFESMRSASIVSKASELPRDSDFRD